MADEFGTCTKTSHHMEHFGEWTVYGFQYENGRGERGWHTTSWKRDPIHDFWVQNGKFYEISIHYAYRDGDEMLMQIYGEVSSVSPEEKKVVLDAIEKWEKQDAE